MSEHPEDVGAVVEEVAEEKTEEKVQHHEPPLPVAVTERSAPLEEVKNKINRMFGREKPVHHCLGGGKPADILLWKNKKISAGIVGGVTLFWVLFECFGYHLITLVCHCLMLGLGILFIWSTATMFINKTPPNIPEIVIPEDVVVKVAVALRYEINRGFAILREIASGKDLKKFLTVIVGLWVLSVVGSWCNFLTLFYIAFLGLHTLPVLYDKYENEVDALAEKATIEIKKQYAVFEAQVLSKIPKGPLKDKKH